MKKSQYGGLFVLCMVFIIFFFIIVLTNGSADGGSDLNCGAMIFYPKDCFFDNSYEACVRCIQQSCNMNITYRCNDLKTKEK